MSDQTKYDFIENGDDKRAEAFYSFCWDHFRNQMRVMIVAYVETDEGYEAYEQWLESFDSPEERANVAADNARDLKEDR